MPTLPFVAHDGPQTDFFISTAPSPELEDRMVQLGAHVRRYAHYVAFVWEPRLGDTFISGAGVLDGHFYFGPRSLPRQPATFGSGNYAVVSCSETSAQVTADPFGLVSVYAAKTFVTNRLHLAALTQPGLDVDAALTMTYDGSGFSFGFNIFQTPIPGVSLIPASSEVTIDSTGIHVKDGLTPDEFDTLTPTEYWKYIDAGACDLVRNATAIADSGLPVFVDITGGKDSRLVFGAIVAAGKQQDVIFNTIANPSTPGLKRDLEIGTGLVAMYGGSYGARPRATGYAHHSVRDNLLKRRSQVLGAYHWIVPSDIAQVTTLTKQPTIRIMGGGGEVFRDRWHYLLFQRAPIGELATPESLGNMLDAHRIVEPDMAGISRHYQRYRERIIDCLMECPGRTIGHKIDSHFLHFRNRLHFGSRQSMAESMFGLSLTSSLNLLKAYRGLPDAERVTGRVAFDVLRVLDERLPYLEYDKPFDDRILASPYHRRSTLDGSILPLPPRPELATSNVRRGHVAPPRRPPAEAVDFRAVLDQEISESREILLGNESAFSFLGKDEMDDYINWGRAKSVAQHSAVASKLRAFADFDELTH